MQYSKLKVLHCEFEKVMLDELMVNPIAIAVVNSRIDIKYGAMKCTDKEGEYGLQMVFKFRVFKEDNITMIGSYIAEKWAFLKFPNQDDVALMKDIKNGSDQILMEIRDEFDEIKKKRNYPFAGWSHVEVGFEYMDAALKSLREV